MLNLFQHLRPHPRFLPGGEVGQALNFILAFVVTYELLNVFQLLLKNMSTLSKNHIVILSRGYKTIFFSYDSLLSLLFLLKEKVSKKFKAGAMAPPAQPCLRTSNSHYRIHHAL
jgi:hypothetical protein